MALPGEGLVTNARQRKGGQGLCSYERPLPRNQTASADGWSMEPAPESPLDLA